jgi:hypothetical protein
VSVLRLFLPVVVLVVLMGDVVVEVVVVFLVDVILKEVVELEIMSLANALIVAVVIILWILVGIYTTNHLDLPIKFFT